MEVHAHSHTERKKWTHYIWEFLMLFLAVFCGFLAEYQLEHKIEKDREKQYIKSFIEDLISDTTEMQYSLKMIDSFFIPVHTKSISLLYAEDFSDSSIRKMYETVPLSIRLFDIVFEKRTIDQLRNSGNLRLIRNKKITDSIAAYLKSCNRFTTIILPSYEETRRIAKEFCFSLFNNNYYERKTPFSPLIKNIPLQLLSADKIEFIKLANNIGNLYSQLTGPITSRLIETNKQAERLINLIKKEYHLK